MNELNELNNTIMRLMRFAFCVKGETLFYLSMTRTGFHFSLSGDASEPLKYHFGVAVGNGVQLAEGRFKTLGELRAALKAWLLYGPRTREEVNR